MVNRCFMIACLACVAIEAQDFRLISEKSESFGPSGSKTEIFTAYGYDDAGNRIFDRSYVGADDKGAALGAKLYAYNGSGQMVRQITLSGADTVTDASYTYGLAAKPIKIIVKGAGGNLRYTDSLAYDAQGHLLGESRVNAAGAIIYRYRYEYDDGMRLISDTLYEPDTSLVTHATQARVISYNGDGTVREELLTRISEGAWYDWQRNAMLYGSGKLIATVSYNGSSRGDSTGYTYDVYGNRSEQAHYDSDGDLVDRTYYNWMAITTALHWNAGMDRSGDRKEGSMHFSVEGVLYNLQGRRDAHTLKGIPLK